MPRLKRSLLFFILLVLSSMAQAGTPLPHMQDLPQLVRQAERIVFLGDSITYGGKYVVYFDVWLAAQRPENPATVINVGLPSETVSGLSEPGHAGGRFPRPDLAKRLDAVMDATKPNLVFACYGINCGIYKPLDEQRMAAYQCGIPTAASPVAARGAQLVLITPPQYDDQRGKLSFPDNKVMQRYSKWLLSQRDQGALVVDLNGPMTREVARCRQRNSGVPTFHATRFTQAIPGIGSLLGRSLGLAGHIDGVLPDAPALIAETNCGRK